MKNMNVSKSSTSYTVNGKNYSSFDELPEDAKKLLADNDGNGQLDIIDEAMRNNQSVQENLDVNVVQKTISDKSTNFNLNPRQPFNPSFRNDKFFVFKVAIIVITALMYLAFIYLR